MTFGSIYTASYISLDVRTLWDVTVCAASRGISVTRDDLNTDLPLYVNVFMSEINYVM